jgi:hypothetical protein
VSDVLILSSETLKFEDIRVAELKVGKQITAVAVIRKK